MIGDIFLNCDTVIVMRLFGYLLFEKPVVETLNFIRSILFPSDG